MEKEEGQRIWGSASSSVAVLLAGLNSSEAAVIGKACIAQQWPVHVRTHRTVQQLLSSVMRCPHIVAVAAVGTGAQLSELCAALQQHHHQLQLLCAVHLTTDSSSSLPSSASFFSSSLTAPRTSLPLSSLHLLGAFLARTAHVTAARAAVFDVGGVLLRSGAPQLAQAMFGEAAVRFAGMHAVYESPVWKSLDRGTLSYEHAMQILDYNRFGITKEDFAEWLQRFPDAMTALEGGSNLVDQLHARGVPCFVLSNFHEPSFKRVTTLNPQIFGKMTECVVSYQCKLMKPEPEMFAHLGEVLAKHGGIRLEDACFFDDTYENILGAWRAGMSAAWIHPANIGYDDAKELLKYRKLL